MEQNLSKVSLEIEIFINTYIMNFVINYSKTPRLVILKFWTYIKTKSIELKSVEKLEMIQHQK